MAGIPSLIGVLAGIHWIGAPLGIVLFGLWCGRLAMTRAAAPAGGAAAGSWAARPWR